LPHHTVNHGGQRPAWLTRHRRGLALFVSCLAFSLHGVGTATGVVSVNDGTMGATANAFEFGGSGWYYRSSGQPSYLGDDHYSKVAGSYYRVRFDGTYAKVYTAKGLGAGVAAISIDGGAETLVDLYAPSRQNQVLVYSSPSLIDAPHVLTVRVTGTKNPNATDSYVIADRVEVGAELPPVNAGLPVVSGTAVVGETLTSWPGTWSNSSTSYAYQWVRCDSAGANCAGITGATGPVYLLDTADQGATLRVVVTASNVAGSTSGTSVQTAVVEPPAAPLWRSVLNDGFDSGGVPSYWRPHAFRYRTSDNCASPSHVSVSGGYLRLLMRYETTGWCGAGWYTGGLTLAKVAPYASVDQRITIRFRVVNGGVIAHRVIPMRWPTTATQPAGGEEDYCESHDLTFCATFLHSSWGYIPRSHIVNLTQWHTFRFERRNYVVRVWIDNMSTPVWTYYGSSTTLPATLKAAVLQQECQPLRVGGCPKGTTGYEEIQIDWITIENPA
jgi:hypothetical protein